MERTNRSCSKTEAKKKAAKEAVVQDSTRKAEENNSKEKKVEKIHACAGDAEEAGESGRSTKMAPWFAGAQMG